MTNARKYVVEFAGHRVVVSCVGKSGRLVSSTLHEPVANKDVSAKARVLAMKWDVYADAIESMILAHACAMVDVDSPEYLEGLETAYDAYGNND